MNANIAEYHVPVNADVRDIRVIFVDEPDEIINPLGIKGAGEAGAIPGGALFAQAIEDALDLKGRGVELLEIPLSPSRLFELTRKARV